MGNITIYKLYFLLMCLMNLLITFCKNLILQFSCKYLSYSVKSAKSLEAGKHSPLARFRLHGFTAIK